MYDVKWVLKAKSKINMDDERNCDVNYVDSNENRQLRLNVIIEREDMDRNNKLSDFVITFIAIVYKRIKRNFMN